MPADPLGPGRRADGDPLPCAHPARRRHRSASARRRRPPVDARLVALEMADPVAADAAEEPQAEQPRRGAVAEADPWRLPLETHRVELLLFFLADVKPRQVPHGAPLADKFARLL
ncbi:hypothetical protein FOCC_FOCC004069 [Frankliniella occidentalis]|nr:hypothetical protein FOCC_FOCC004069 [Frankliniella occidentalis]